MELAKLIYVIVVLAIYVGGVYYIRKDGISKKKDKHHV
jgi:hypothetical protein